ncbi:helix-turn-helix domain-containing protein [Chryseobacterium sp. 2R14A]|uniref:helix-turn-helix domain-containing protein n=1 Tax=Chryseobacterium sp. 2R14A TaxID=3380353 RepID=UPI003CEAE856
MNNQELRERRKALGITQEDAAKLLGIAFQTYNIYENKGKLTKTKLALIERVFSELESKKTINSVFEEKSEYLISDKKYSPEELLSEIYKEVKVVRKENEQLNEAITQMQKDGVEEKKKNDLLRKQLQLAINVLKDLDLELLDLSKGKSTGAKHNVSKAE